ncbi:GNAT family N-acetyltransferase [Brachybacterium sp. AOP43-C2-M15]|uniref:GNAT family N-acetyltransferase n=1 Tax=Brachybacterium sp. AOP43-C2-M15 TaxID=3457661 RepID=UPI00403380A2
MTGSTPRSDPGTDTGRCFTIDTPTLADVPALARLHVRGWEVAYGHALAGEQWFGQPAIRRRIEHWTAWLTPGNRAADEGEFRIGRDPDGAPVGLAASWPPRDPEPVRERELSTLYVDEAWFGSGLGRALVESLLGEAPASLWVAEDNPRARRFYEKLGFVADGARHTDERWPDLPDLRMVR